MVEKRTTCLKCDQTLAQPKTGRPRVYCSQACRRSAEFEIKRVQSRLQLLEQILMWKEPLEDGLPKVRRLQAEKEIAELKERIGLAEQRLLALLQETSHE